MKTTSIQPRILANWDFCMDDLLNRIWMYFRSMQPVYLRKCGGIWYTRNEVDIAWN